MQEIEEDKKKWKNVPYSWTGRTNTVKMSMLPSAIYTFNAIPMKIPSIFSKKCNKRLWIPRGLMKTKDKVGGITIWDFKLYSKSCNHQDSMVLAQKQTQRSMEQNKKPRNGPSTLWSTNLTKQERMPNGRKKSLQKMVLRKLDIHMQKNETGPFPHTTHKNRLKMDERP